MESFLSDLRERKKRLLFEKVISDDTDFIKSLLSEASPNPSKNAGRRKAAAKKAAAEPHVSDMQDAEKKKNLTKEIGAFKSTLSKLGVEMNPTHLVRAMNALKDGKGSANGNEKIAKAFVAIIDKLKDDPQALGPFVSSLKKVLQVAGEGEFPEMDDNDVEKAAKENPAKADTEKQETGSGGTTQSATPGITALDPEDVAKTVAKADVSPEKAKATIEGIKKEISDELKEVEELVKDTKDSGIDSKDLTAAYDAAVKGIDKILAKDTIEPEKDVSQATQLILTASKQYSKYLAQARTAAKKSKDDEVRKQVDAAIGELKGSVKDMADMLKQLTGKKGEEKGDKKGKEGAEKSLSDDQKKKIQAIMKNAKLDPKDFGAALKDAGVISEAAIRNMIKSRLIETSRRNARAGKNAPHRLQRKY